MHTAHRAQIYSSDEGRVQSTAAAFAKGLLDLEGDLTPIMVSLVRKDKAVNDLLDDTHAALDDVRVVVLVLDSRLQTERVKAELHRLLRSDAGLAQLAATTTDVASVQRAIQARDALHACMGGWVTRDRRLGRLPPQPCTHCTRPSSSC